jgi:4-amino-4-deoxy-L-arabinose transferase-like glycosyltransferase
LIAVVTAALYLPQLGRAPVYLYYDEVFFALQARSIATNGRDTSGNVLPLLVEYRYDAADNGTQRSGWMPAIVCYAIALTLKVLPFSEASIRLPTVVVAVVDVVLMYFIGLRLFKRESLSLLCAGLLALTPAHFMLSRFALDLLFPVPCVLAWLLCVLAYLEDGRERKLFAATLWLGTGLFTYIASVITMSACLVLTLAAIAWSRRPVRAYGTALLGFGIPAAVFLLWVALHPAAIGDTLAKYDVPGADALNPLQSLRGLLTRQSVADRLSRYWVFFDPRFLFFDGPMEPMFSTRTVGVFVLPVFALLLLGLRTSLRRALNTTSLLLLGGLAVTPLPLTLTVIPDAVARVLPFLPFVILLSVCGVEYLWSLSWQAPRRLFVRAGVALLAAGIAYGTGTLALHSRLPGAAVPMIALGGLAIAVGVLQERLRPAQVLASVLLVFVPIEFAGFYRDYFTGYQNRMAFALSGNLRGAFEEVISEDRVASAPAVYLVSLGRRGDMYWTFYRAKHHREDLAPRTFVASRFDADQVVDLQAGSLIVTGAGDAKTDAAIERLVRAGQISRTVITEPDGVPTYMVLRRLAAARAAALRSG